MNLYGFVKNSSINYVDVAGMMAFPTWPPIPKKGKIALFYIKALATTLMWQYRANLGRCHNTYDGCYTGCGLVSAEGAALLQVAFVECKLNGIQYWPGCYLLMIKGGEALGKWDTRCKSGCKKKKCCFGSKEPKYFGDPSVMEAWLDDVPKLDDK